MTKSASASASASATSATTGASTVSEPTIIRTVAEIRDASTPVLLATYNAITGKSITRFASREVGERQVENAMLSSRNADGQLGVPQHADGQVKTAEELAQKAVEKGQPAPDLTGDGESSPVFPFGSMADQLQKAAAAKAAIPARAKKEAKTGTPRAFATHVMANPAGTGTSKVRETSQRGAILARILATGGAVSVQSLDDHFQQSTKGYIQKLCEAAHVFTCDEAGKPLAE